MGRKGITYDQVANAAQAITARGTEPTISAIRVELNNEGSYSTISQHLNRWRSESAERVDTAALPPDVESAAMEAITKVWNIAHKHANKEVAAARQEAADDKAAMKKELDEARAEIAHLEEANRRLDDEITKATARAEQAEKKLTEVSGELQAHKDLYAALLESTKPQAASGKKAADTTRARPSTRASGPEKTPGETH